MAAVTTIDISPDGTKIATGSNDKTACVWSFPTGRRLLGPFKHGNHVVATKFSPNGRVIATATGNSVRVYDSRNGRLLVDVPIEGVPAWSDSNSLAWASDAKQLFALSDDGNIHRLDASTGTTLSKWPIHSSKDARCIALASNGALIAASAGSSVSLWNTTTHEQIGSVIWFTHHIRSMAISPNDDLMTAGSAKITFRGLCHIFSSSHFDLVSTWIKRLV